MKTVLIRFGLVMMTVIGAMAVLVWMTIPHGAPDESQARQDFTSQYPDASIESIWIEEQEVVATSYRIKYRLAGDPSLHELSRHYVHDDRSDSWRLLP